MPKKDNIVAYIVRQREHGWKDGQIREHMELRSGYTPGMLNNYFKEADKIRVKNQASRVLAPVAMVLLLVVGGVYFGGGDSLTGAASWWSKSSYSCGDDVPKNSIMDLSDCVDDSEDYKSTLFCYYNKDISVDSLHNDAWYSSERSITVSDFTTINNLDLLGASPILPWDASGDDVECVTWDYGRALSSSWHECTDDDSDGTPDNLVLYYNDVTVDSDISVGGLTTSLDNSGSYYLCYDELDCSVESSCDTSSDEYCVAGVGSTSGYYPCDSTEVSSYLCCTGSCSGTSMVCGEKILSQDETISTEFTECIEDGTSACCSSSNACVYDGECYDQYDGEEIRGVDMWCSNDNTWCPEGFAYSSVRGWCYIAQTACYSTSDTDYCNYIIGTDDTDDWEGDTSGSYPCVQETSSDPPYEGCIWQEISGMDYYFYQNIGYY
jgi:hypothetical protein